MWKDRVNKLVSEMCFESWRKENTKKDGSRYVKHRPYRVPQIACLLVDCLNKNDEARAKALMFELMDVPELSRD